MREFGAAVKRQDVKRHRSTAKREGGGPDENVEQSCAAAEKALCGEEGFEVGEGEFGGDGVAGFKDVGEERAF